MPPLVSPAFKGSPLFRAATEESLAASEEYSPFKAPGEESLPFKAPGGGSPEFRAPDEESYYADSSVLRSKQEDSYTDLHFV